MSAPIEVVVPARDAADTLRACLSGLRDAGFAPGEVIVVDDASWDATLDIAEEFGVRRVALRTAGGAAAARNAGVAGCDAPIVLFVDADVVLHPGMRDRILRFFEDHPDHSAVIGSYDDAPPAPGGLSRIRNLLHHHTHQEAPGDVASFWTGCGAIRRADLVAAGGFEPGHPLEDVALGLALARRGQRVRLDPSILCTHLKRWTLRSMIRADLFYRALPWSRMLLDPRNGDIAAQLNAGGTGKLSVVLAGLALAGLVLLPLVLVPGLVVVVVALGALAVVHWRFLALVERRLGIFFAVQAVGVLWVHFCCAGAGYAWALLERVRSRAP